MKKIKKYFLIPLILTSCCTIEYNEVKVIKEISGYSNNINVDTLKYPDLYPLGELHLKVIQYEYVATKDSIHLFFEGLFAFDNVTYIKYCSFDFISDNRIILNTEEMLPSYDGKFKIVIPIEEGILNVAIKSYEYDYAFASYKIEIE